MIDRLRGIVRRVLTTLENLPPWAEIALFATVVLLAAGVRFHALDVVPGYIWSKDATGYAEPAYRWLDTGEWIFDGRRGPVYSMFLGYIGRFFGGMPGVMHVQHFLAFAGIMATLAAARFYFGRKAAWIVGAAGIAFAVYGPPIHYAHLIRNETLLFLCACVSLAAWAVSIKRRSLTWLALAGLSAGILTLTKNVFLPFPVMAAAATIWLLRARPPAAAVYVLALFAAFLLPFGLERWHERHARVVNRPEPQAGILLYGRVAQWTVLDGGIEPELKREIRTMIEEYRQLPKLDNNIILKDTAVPRLKEILYNRGGSPSDLNRLCKRLALEAIRAEPAAYARQVWGDIRKVLFELGEGADSIEAGEVSGSIARLREIEAPHPLLRAEANIAALDGRDSKVHLAQLDRPQKLSWLFRSSPVAWSLLCVTALVILSRSGDQRVWWLGHAALICFTLVLLSTVGRPLQRYIVPIMPVMFWVLTGTLVALLKWAGRWAGAPPDIAAGPAQAPVTPAGVRG
jgi:hypothetical protein